MKKIIRLLLPALLAFTSFPAFSENNRTFTGRIRKLVIENTETGEAAIASEFYETKSKKSYSLTGNLQPLLDFNAETKIRITARYDRKSRILKTVPAKKNKKQTASYKLLSAKLESSAQGTKRTLVILGSFKDKELPCTQESVNETYFGAADSVADLVNKSSEGRLNIQGAVTPVFQIPLFTFEYNCNNYEQARKILLQKAKAAGFNENQYDYVSFVFPAQCSYVGVAEIGGKYNWSHACSTPRTVVHELGHNFGMFHATSYFDQIRSEYGDLSDYMGDQISYVNAPHLDQMQWRTSSEISEVSRPGDFYLKPLYGGQANDTNPRMIRIASPDLLQPLYLSYRNFVAPPSFPLPFRYQFKISIHEYSGGESRTKLVALLGEGETYRDPATDYGITFKTISPQRAVVNVNMPCIRNRPDISVKSVNQSQGNNPPGTNFSYQLIVKNNDSALCEGSNLTLAVQSGEEITLPGFPKQVNLLPKAAYNENFQFASAAGLAGGNYSFLVKAEDSVSHADLAGFGAANYPVTNTAQASRLPQVTAGSVVNSANYSNASLAPGALVTIFGSQLSGENKICRSDTTPHPSELCGTRIFVSGNIPVPLSFVSGNQINAQLPYEVPVQTNTALTIRVNSLEAHIPLIRQKAGPAIFATKEGNKTLAVAQHNADSSPVSRTSPAKLREYVTLYTTGLGLSFPESLSAYANPGAYSALMPFELVFTGSKGQFNIRKGLLYAGRAPGYVGLDQINVQIPKEPLSSLSGTELLDMVVQVCPLASGLNNADCSNAVNLPLGVEE